MRKDTYHLEAARAARAAGNTNVLAYLTSAPLVQALWWAVENSDALTSDMFFQLRERVRNHKE
jgi:hypothetical protein